MAGVITASEPFWITLFSGLSQRSFRKLITVLRREGLDPVRQGRPWSLPLEDRVLLVTTYWRTNLTLRQSVPLLGSQSLLPTASSSIWDLVRGSARAPAQGTLLPTHPGRTRNRPPENWRALARHLGRREHMDDTLQAIAGLLSQQQTADRIPAWPT